jgi:hypothetical protein
LASENIDTGKSESFEHLLGQSQDITKFEVSPEFNIDVPQGRDDFNRIAFTICS